LNPNLKPIYIIANFEKAALNAFKKAFSRAILQGCLFHLSQNLHKKIVNCGLKSRYSTDENPRLYSRALLALAFLHKKQVRNCFYFLTSQASFPSELNDVYAYFFNYYIGFELHDLVLYPIDPWHVRSRLFSDLPRTNNAIEGWHNSFRTIFGNLNPIFKNFMIKVKHEERFAHQKFLMLTNGNEIKKVKKYIVFSELLV
jgi:hypothetical protein